MEIPYHYSYSCTPNMNSKKINTNIIFIPNVFLKHLYPTLIITSLGIEKYIYQYNTSRFLKINLKDFKYRDLTSFLRI